jgi:hypothetical protein
MKESLDGKGEILGELIEIDRRGYGENITGE